jgi:pimeloyl-ACP methyl ester carboxylesterase
VSIGTGVVHCRVAGNGGVVLVLGAGNGVQPLMPVIEAIAQDFQVLVVDLPGYGLSDPLPVHAPAVEDYAWAIARLLDVLAVRRCAVIGSHTGAFIAAALAAERPDLCALLLLHELSFFSDSQKRDYLAHYLPTYAPAWHGGHLIAFWHRYREQMLFRPWHRPSAATRKRGPGDSVEDIHQVFMTQAMAGAGYAACYRAVIKHGLNDTLRRLAVPWHLIGPDDSWVGPARAQGFHASAISPSALSQHCRQLLGSAAGELTNGTPAHPPAAARQLIASGPHVMSVRQWRLPTAHAHWLVIPQMPGPAETAVGLCEALSPAGTVTLVEPPGNGASIGPLLSDPLGEMREAVERVMDVTGRPSAIIGIGTGCVVGADIARRSPQETALHLINPPLLTPGERADLSGRYAEDIRLAWDGSHLVRLWHALRNEALFWPWYRQDGAHVREDEPALDTLALDRRLLGIMQRYGDYGPLWRSFIQADLQEMLSALADDGRVHVYLHAGGLFAEVAQRARNVLPAVSGWPAIAHRVMAVPRRSPQKSTP